MNLEHQQLLEQEAKMKEQVKRIKRKIKRYPKEIQKNIEDTMIASIVYNSQAIEEDTLPEKEAMEFLIRESKDKEAGVLFDE